MILLYVVLGGLLAGLLRAWLTNQRFALPDLQAVWLVPLAFLPQWLIFFWAPTRNRVPHASAAIVLVSSLVLLLLFAWVNRQQRAFWWLGLGLCLNLLVIVLNHGLMPITPEVLIQLRPYAQSPENWQLGRWLNNSKDIVLPATETRLIWLTDYFLLPKWFPIKAAFSLGDVLISIGACWLLWQAGGIPAPATNSPHRLLSKSPSSRKEDVERS